MGKNRKQEKKQGPLRFTVGDDVIFRRKDMLGWHAGTVEDVWYRNAKWPDSRQSCPYRVEQKSAPGRSEWVLIEEDTDAKVRVMKHARFPTLPVLIGDIPLAEPKDPLSYLYQPFPENELFQAIIAGQGMKKQDDQKLEVEKQLPNGGIIAKIDAPGALNEDEKTFFLPNMEAGSVEHRGEPVVHIISYIAPRVELRRPAHQYGKFNAEQLFHSIFPQEPSVSALQKTIRRLEEAEQIAVLDPMERCKKLLNLGDALLFLFRPLECKRDFERARRCYRAAGFDLLEKDVREERTGRPEGLPEALCCEAVIIHYTTERLLYCKINHLHVSQAGSAGLERPMLDVGQVVASAFLYPDAAIRNNIDVTVSFLASALRQGYVSALAYFYGRALQDRNPETIWRDPLTQKNIRRLQMAYQHQQLILHLQEEKVATPCVTQHGIPSEETMSYFAPRAMNVLRNIPPCSMTQHPDDDAVLDLRISFFEVDVPSSPMCVLIFCPGASTFELLRLPDKMQLFPFSLESFQWIWQRIAYLIHLGIRKQSIGVVPRGGHEARVRPRYLRLKNVGGDLQFANFLQMKCFLLPGTRVQLLEVSEDSEDEMGLHDEDRQMQWVAIRAGIKQLQNEEAARQAFVISRLKPSSQSMLSIMRNSPQSVAETNDEMNRVFQKTSSFKSSGNAAFGGKRYMQARRHYEKGIAEARRAYSPTKELMELVGTLVSNWAICGLEVAKTQTPSYGAFTLKEVEAACNMALNNGGINGALSPSVRSRMRFRRDLASARQPSTDPSTLNRRDEFRGATMVILDIDFNLRLFKEGSQGSGSPSSKRITVKLGKELADTKADDMICPICREDFSAALADQFIIQLPCGHFHCAKCFLGWKQSGKVNCGICRASVEMHEWNEALEKIVNQSFVEEQVTCLPLNTKAERLEAFRSLFLKHNLDLSATSRALDDMLYLINLGYLSQTEDLMAHEKMEVYNDARRPVAQLEAELTAIHKERDDIFDRDSEEFRLCDKKAKATERMLRLAKQNAEAEIFSRMNASGSMAKANSEGEIQLDFHGLHVKEAKHKVEELIVPVLPALKRLIVITGRGKHSSTKGSALKPALQKFIARKHGDTIEWEPLRDNFGAVRLRFKAAPSLD